MPPSVILGGPFSRKVVPLKVFELISTDCSMRKRTFIDALPPVLDHSGQLSGDLCGREVNTLNSGSRGLRFKPYTLHCFLRQGPLLHFVSLHLGV